MKKINRLIAIFLLSTLLLTSCSLFGGSNISGDEGFGDSFGDGFGDGKGEKLEAQPFPNGAFASSERKAIIGSIIQTGDGNAYVNGSVPSLQSRQRAALSSLLNTKKNTNTK